MGTTQTAKITPLTQTQTPSSTQTTDLIMQAQTDLKKDLPLRLRFIRPAVRRGGARSRSRSRRVSGEKPAATQESNQAATALVTSVLRHLVDVPQKVGSHLPKTAFSNKGLEH